MNWISVKDRLPENDQLILFHCPQEDPLFEVGVFSHYKDSSGNIKYRLYPFDVAHWEISNDDDSYWIPLPTLPKEEDQPTEITLQDIQDTVNYLKSEQCFKDGERRRELEIASLLNKEEDRDYILVPLPTLPKEEE